VNSDNGVLSHDIAELNWMRRDDEKVDEKRNPGVKKKGEIHDWCFRAIKSACCGAITDVNLRECDDQTRGQLRSGTWSRNEVKMLPAKISEMKLINRPNISDHVPLFQ
jgi:hypothetical protein